VEYRALSQNNTMAVLEILYTLRLYCIFRSRFLFSFVFILFVILEGSQNSPHQAGVLNQWGGESVICHGHYVVEYNMITNKQTSGIW
jgi:hypothetical protein